MSDDDGAGKARLEPLVGCTKCGRDRCLIDGLCDDCTLATNGTLFPWLKTDAAANATAHVRDRSEAEGT